ncbi:proton-conducting transporter transmembrane domain-containing protein [Castellaniella caeni]|uniref:proton-conducting transporter transmembrane domain-containing protein n=1 Tax=Castellaniella caeni TaxID=266123 RepID=UPI0008371BE2|nr:proton-conducting transporter membrane subunit [Castellaniella caeni]
MLAWILLIPVIAALVALASQRAAPWITLATAIVVFALSAAAAAQTGQGAALQSFGGGLSLDAFSAVYLVLVAFVGVTAALYSIGYLPAHYPEREGVAPRYRAYWPLYNLFMASMLAVPLIANLAVVWIAIELTTVFSAFLVAYEDRPTALEAAWKYVALTSMGAMIALFGVLVLYYAVHDAGQPVTWPGLIAAAPRIKPALLSVSFALWLVGFGTKAGLVPMHTWLPDAHSQAPASICGLLSGVEVSGALYMLLRIHPALMRNPAGLHSQIWYLAAGLLSVAAAAFLLLQVHDFKRLFAYSTIEHMGVILVACGLGANAQELGTVYQFFAHAFTKSFCFYVAGLATIVCGTQEIAAVRGLMHRAPLLGWGLLLGGLAIAGAPPFALFVSEFQIIATGFAAGEYAATALLTALLVLAFVAILYQIGRIVFGGSVAAKAHAALPATSLAAVVLAFVPMFIFGFYVPPPLLALLRQAAALLGGAG